MASSTTSTSSVVRGLVHLDLRRPADAEATRPGREPAAAIAIALVTLAFVVGAAAVLIALGAVSWDGTLDAGRDDPTAAATSEREPARTNDDVVEVAR